MEDNNFKLPFQPVQGPEKSIKSVVAKDGHIYFTTDTKKIFLAKDGNYLPMGGNSGIYYGNRLITEEEKEAEVTSFIFYKEDIEGEEFPTANDLILNIPDGSFYRVLKISEDESEATCERLTIAGSGSSGSGEGTTSSRPVVNDPFKGEDQYFNTTDIKNMKINFFCTSQNSDSNRVDQVEYYIGTTKIYTDNKGYEFNKNIEFDIYPYLNLLSTSTRNTLAIKVIDIYGNESKKKNFYFYLVKLELTSTFNTIYYGKKDEKSFSYFCVPIGGAGLENRFVNIKLAPIDNPTNYIFNENYVVKNTNINLNLTIDPGAAYAHGVYILKAAFCAILPNGEMISSQEKIHQIIFYDSDVNTPLIAGLVPATKISQYDSMNITYMIVDEQTTTEKTDVYLYVNGEFRIDEATIGTQNIWEQTFLETGFYDLQIGYKNQIKKLSKIEVTMYEGELPVIDSTNLELSLSAQGRFNTESNKETWGYNDYNGIFENFLWGGANGWLKDNKNQTALKLTNGAKFTLPTYHPFSKDATERGLTIELDFMFSGVLDYSKPLIQCLSIDKTTNVISTGFHITGQKATLNSSINKATTMVLDGEEDENGNINETDMALQGFTQYFNEDERIHLTYVIERIPDYAQIEENSFYFVYTYLNGVLSGIMKLKADKASQTKEQFIDYKDNASFIKVDSTYGDIYLYNIRVYRGALDTRTVINNYIADLSNIDEKIELYKVNKIFTDDGLINLNAIQDISYQLKVPYILLKGGSSMPKKFKDAITYTDKINYSLPLTKEDFKLMSLQMFDRLKDNEKPIFEVPIELEDTSGKKISSFKDIEIGKSYKMNRGVQVYGQGTSSMVYPVKNLRLKFRKEQDYPIVYNDAYPIEIACFKADYMDSSASHNTGTANLIYDILKQMNLYSPAQEFKNNHIGEEGVAEHDLITAIRGFPIICFYAEGDSDEYTYIGRYNFNIDKATPEPFGFFPQKVYTGQTTIDNQGRERKEVEAIGLKVEKVNGMTVLPLDSDGKEIERDIIQCWEVLNNDTGSPTKFLTLENFRDKGREGFKESLIAVNDKGNKYGWMEYYEDRYPDAMVDGGTYSLTGEKDPYDNLEEDLENGLFRLVCWINSTATNEVTNTNLDEPVYYKTRDLTYNTEKEYYNYTNGQYLKKEIEFSKSASIKIGEALDKNYPNNLGGLSIQDSTFNDKVQGVLGQYNFIYVTSEEQNSGWYLGEEFIGANLQSYGISYTGNPVNTNVLIVTFNETNDWSPTLFECFTVDNEEYRLSKFKDEFENYINLDFALFYYVLTMLLLMMDSRAKNMMLASWDQTIWYPIFYDMDTALGVNNTGFNKFAYDTEDDPKDRVFNGYDSVLWNNFRECFYSEICNFYAEARKYLTTGKLLSTYNANASDKWNEALTTADAEYKYIRPYENGFYDGKNTDENNKPVWVGPGKVSYLYAGQGRRTNHRSYWLNNRAKYFDSKYIPLTLDPSSGITVDAFNFRAYSLPEQKSNEKTNECVLQTPASHKFNITALNNSYQSIYIGNILYGPVFASANEEVELGPSQVKHEVESYILNPELISNLGDLSNKYLGQFNFPTGKTRLTELNFGRSSRSHPGQFDKYYNKLLSSLNIGDSCPYLQKVNIARCTGLKTIDFSKCNRLRELDAEGTVLTDITFPVDSILEKLYLPNTLTSLALINQPHLQSIIFDNIIDGTAGINTLILDRISTINTYPIVKNTFATDNSKNKYFYFNEINWVLDDIKDVVLDSEKTIKEIVILEKLLEATPRNGMNHAQAVSGTITISIPDIKVNQYEIYEKYNKLFPNLTINYDNNKVNIQEAKVVIFYSDTKENNPNIFYQVYTDGTKTINYLTSAIGPNGVALGTPAKASSNEYDYVFSGNWKVNGTIYTPETIQSFTPGESLTEFYPIYNEIRRKYFIKFYDYDGTVLYELEKFWQESYSVPNYAYRDSNDLDYYERWSFQGWSLNNYGETNPINPEYLNTSNMIVSGNLIAYAHYIKEDVRKIATRNEYFSFSSIDGETAININSLYRKEVKGKITLPSKNSNGEIIKCIGDFSDCDGITHVFFLSDNEYEIVYGTNNDGTAIGAFTNCYNLSGIDLPGTIKIIGYRAFGATDTNKAMKITIKELPKNLEEIYPYAFYNAGINISISELPENLKYIGDWAFAYCSNFKVNNFNVHSIGKSAFIQSGKVNNFNTITLNKELKQVANSKTFSYDKAFYDYGANITKVIIHIESEFYNEDYAPNNLTPRDLGFNVDTADICTCDENGG